MEKNKRKLKVCRSYRGGNIPISQLLLKGSWLSEYGFDIGDFVTVECLEGKLVIQKEKTLKVAIVGSRGLFIDISPHIPPNCGLIISGGAKGIDTLAEQYAALHSIKTLIIKPDYDKYGRAAPIRRNDTIVDSSDLVIAFWDGKSRGTKYVIDYAQKTGKPIQIIKIEVSRHDS